MRDTDHPAPFAYPRHYEVRRVKSTGVVRWRNRAWYLSAALRGMAVGLTKCGTPLTYLTYLSEIRC